MGKGIYSAVVESSDYENHEKCCKTSCFSTKCLLCTLVIFCFLILVAGLICVYLASDHSETNSLNTTPTSRITIKTSRKAVNLSNPEDIEIRLKEGVVNWMKDQMDPDMVIAGYNLTKFERTCITNSTSPDVLALNDSVSEAMKLIEKHCPSAMENAEKVYEGIHRLLKRYDKWRNDFAKDLPETIVAPIIKIYNLSNEIVKMPNSSKEDKLLKIMESINQILNASQEDIEILARKHTFLSPFFTGNLREDLIKIVTRRIQITNKIDVEKNEKEIRELIKPWILQAKAAVVDYLETRERQVYLPEESLPEDIDKQFTAELQDIYDKYYSLFVN